MALLLSKITGRGLESLRPEEGGWMCAFEQFLLGRGLGCDFKRVGVLIAGRIAPPGVYWFGYIF